MKHTGKHFKTNVQIDRILTDAITIPNRNLNLSVLPWHLNDNLTKTILTCDITSVYVGWRFKQFAVEHRRTSGGEA